MKTTDKTRSTNFSKKNASPSEFISQAQSIAKDEIQEHYDDVEMFFWEEAYFERNYVVEGEVRLQLVPDGMEPIDCAPEDFEEETIKYLVHLKYDENEKDWKGTVKIE